MRIKTFILLLLAIFLCLPVYAAKVISLTDKNIHGYLLEKKQSLTTLNGHYQYKLSKKISLRNGIIKSKYSLFYENIPVYNIVLLSTESSKSKITWHGKLVLNIEKDLKTVKPKYSKDQIEKLAKNLFKAKKTDKIKNEKILLYIRLNQDAKAELVYMVSFNVEGPKVQRPFYMLNANTGAVIQSWDSLAISKSY